MFINYLKSGEDVARIIGVVAGRLHLGDSIALSSQDGFISVEIDRSGRLDLGAEVAVSRLTFSRFAEDGTKRDAHAIEFREAGGLSLDGDLRIQGAVQADSSRRTE